MFYKIFGWYILLINVLGFLLMGRDKHLAKVHAWRIPERVLLSAAAAGGAFGSLLGMQIFRHKTKHRKFRIGVPLLLFVWILLIMAGDHFLITTSRYEVTSEKLPEDFSGLNVVQLSDIHIVRSDFQRDAILSKVKREKPDLIALTGDLVDAPRYSSGTDMRRTVELCGELAQIAPTYYIYGNHEMILLDDPEKNVFKVAVEEAGVKLLNVKAETFQKAGVTFNICGLQDPSILYKDPVLSQYNDNKSRIEAELDIVLKGLDKDNFTLVLSHRPELLDVYAEYPVDLVLSGHAHGGQVRLPVGRVGLFAPNQGFFPKYTSGTYLSSNGGTEMIVSRGLGESIIPVRFFNMPEIVSVTINSR
ncbi:MAG: DUF1294 domain-containing protein [Lachnospiraceae bacterium]|nr:DUF1294 domain-containing protein [Lachnospiraceae bacterium]